ncbi:MAG: sulfotransferase domain-containing protein [Actinobacteria bacterium]|nr:sulfotransferase domain-containing protein [Actinomycetota bacterium]
MPNLKPTLRRLRFREQTVRRLAVWWRYRSADLNQEDAFLVSYPRSGTTWLRFLLFEALTNKSPGFGSIKEAVPSLTKHHHAAVVLGQRGRLIQSHETFSDGDRRIIYAVRDARSVALSEYQWQRRLGLEPGSLDRFIADFTRGRSNPWGPWDQHVQYWLASEPARLDHLHLIKFEDLRRDTVGTLRLALSFLGVEMTIEELRSVVDNNSVERMRTKEDDARERGWRSRARPDIRFVNQGRSEGWRNELNPQQIKAIETRFQPTLERLGYLSS